VEREDDGGASAVESAIVEDATTVRSRWSLPRQYSHYSASAMQHTAVVQAQRRVLGAACCGVAGTAAIRE
jgi:hypothetical protein